MSGSFESMDVPPTLVSFAVTTDKLGNIVPNHFKSAGSRLVLIAADKDENGLPVTASLLEVFDQVHGLLSSGKALSAYTPGYGGVAEAVMKMSFGNSLGFEYDEGMSLEDIFGYNYGSFLLEVAADVSCGRPVGRVTEKQAISYKGESLSLEALLKLYEDKLESVYPCNIPAASGPVELFSYSGKGAAAPAVKSARPRRRPWLWRCQTRSWCRGRRG